MAHMGNQIVMFVALGVTVAIPIYLWRRKRSVMSGLDALVKERGMIARPSSPVAAFAQPNPPERMHFSAGYDGALRPGVRMSLLLFRRPEAVMAQGVSIENATLYVGVFVPDQPAVGIDFVKPWQEKAQRREDHVVYAARVAEGGAVVIWQGTPSRDNVQARLGELAQSIKPNR